MDSIGQLELNWIQGFQGTKVEYISRDTVCFKCGNFVRFLGEDGHGSVYSPGEGVSCVGVHNINKVFAVAEQTLNPRIYVIAYPSFRQIAELTDGAELEYTSLIFSSSVYLASVSGIPDFLLTLWKYDSGEKLCSVNLSVAPVTSISFNPANWREIFLSTENEMSVWLTEQSSDKYTMQKKSVELVPTAVSNEPEDRSPSMSHRPSTRMTLVLPKTSVAGVRGADADTFERYQDTVEKVLPMSHTWAPTGDIYVGCASGHLLKVGAEEYNVTCLYNPALHALRSETSIETLQLGKQKSHLSDIGERSASMASLTTPMASGSIDCLTLHKEGLFAAGEEGTLRQIELSKNGVKVVRSIPLGQPVKSLTFNSGYSKMAIGSSQGTIQVCEVPLEGDITPLLDTHHGLFIGTDVLAPGTDNLVSVRENGEVQVWKLDNGKLLSSMPLGCQATCMASSPLAHLVFIGTSSGYLIVVDLNNFNNPRMISRQHVHNGPVKHLVFHANGQFLVSASDDGHVFVVDGHPSKKFQPIAHTDIPGIVEGLSVVTDSQTGVSKVTVTARQTDASQAAANKLCHFDLPPDVVLDPKRYQASLKLDFDTESINKMTFNIRHPSHDVAVTHGNIAYTLGHESKKMHKISLPKDPPKKETSRDSYLSPQETAPAHGLPGGRVKMSPHHKWLASLGMDGRLSVRGLGNLDRSVDVTAHDYRIGGGLSLAFSADAQYLMTTGQDGSLACFKWNVGSKGKSAIEAQRAKMASLLKEQQTEDDIAMAMPEWQPPQMASRPESATQKEEKENMEKQKARENDLIYATPTPTPAADATWLEIKELEAIKEEDKQYANMKKEMRTEIREMRRRIQGMMRENEGVPDIEKLGHEEFDLDVEEQMKLQAEGEDKIQKIREEKELDNLSKMYLADLIKKECWDDMVVKGRGIQAFNSTLDVHNYPMRKRTQEELKMLEIVRTRRKVEMDEMSLRKEITEAKKKKPSAAAEEEDNNENGEGEQPSTTGSLGVQYGGGNELFFSQFELHAREQKIQQITLLQDAIYRIKQVFNKEFDEVYHKKEQEITKIKEKNRRIHKILMDLELQVDVFEPEMGVLEKPEMLLEVKEKEVKVEKFLTVAQKKELVEKEKAEEERRLREKGDNPRERALDMMMGGVLEVKKEDELKKDVPVPLFMTSKDESEWSEDEKKMVAEYERKVKELQEEREKYRKQLEAELKKLQAQIQEGTLAYDEALLQLHARKIKTEMVIYQEELKMLRLKYSLLLEEELNNREAELMDMLEFKKEMKGLAADAVNESKKHVEAFRDYYEDLEAHERIMDKEFRRKFNDCSALVVDNLYKLFRKRPRGQRGHLRATQSQSDSSLFEGSGSGNPFADRPSTARRDDHSKKALETALQELDKDINIPEGVELHVWERLCTFRREKIEKENLVKQKAGILAGMNEFLKHRQDEAEQLRVDVEDLSDEITKLQDDRMKFTCNLEVQLMMKQGQVEVDAGSFIPSYIESLLLHRSVIEDLNGRIRQLGESKISSMVESKDFRKGIVQLEWEHKKMTMEMEDLRNKQRDIQNLKVTREIQAFLNEEDHDAKKSQEVQTLEQTIQKQKENHEKHLVEKKKIMKDLKKNMRERTDENDRLGQEAQNRNVSVNERRHIHEVNADKRSDAGRDKRYQEIVQRRKLVDLAKAQAQEVAVLRAEVERLRMRTFPALVQVEH